MKRIAILLSTVLAAATSCGPLHSIFYTEMRTPSSSGLDFRGREVSVTALYGDSRADSLLLGGFAQGMAETLEQDYFSSEPVVGLYSKRQDPEGVYSSRDSLVRLVVETSSDLVLLIEMAPHDSAKVLASTPAPDGTFSADSAYLLNVTVPLSFKVYAYDSMSFSDNVLGFSGKKSAPAAVFVSQQEKDSASFVEGEGGEAGRSFRDKAYAELWDSARKLGIRASSSFMSQWKKEWFYIYYYNDYNERWLKAHNLAMDYRWKDAAAIWMEFLGTKNLQKRACAEYNIALACMMTGQRQLAVDWLERSVKDCRLDGTERLTKYLQAR